MPWTKPYTPARNERLEDDLYCCADRVYFMTIRAFGGCAPFTRDDLNSLVVETLGQRQSADNCAVFTYCLMPNHLHFLVQPGTDGISVLTFTERFKGQSTNLSWSAGWKGKLWQPRYYDHIVREEEDLWRIAEYILNNPVRQGLAETATDWPWSGELNPLVTLL